MKTYTPTELTEILLKHRLWANGEKGGERAYLRGAYLSGAYLRGAYCKVIREYDPSPIFEREQKEREEWEKEHGEETA